MADDLTIRLRLIDEFSSTAGRIRGTLDALKGAAGEFGAGAREGFRQARDEMAQTEAAAERVKSSGFSMTTAMKGVGAAMAGLGLANAAKDAISFGLSTAAANEQAQISFTTLLGSADKAGSFVKDLQAFAAKTPFEFAGLQESSSLLLASGVEANKVIPIMTTLGNVTAGMGTGSEGIKRAIVALQQMNAAGKISGEDLNQLRDAGIPVYDLLASATGKSKEQVVALAQAGKLGKQELGQMMAALESGKGLEKFNGLMDAQSNSLLGLWSSFKDNLGQGLAKLIEPAIPALKVGLQWLGDNIGALPGRIQGWANAITSTPLWHGLVDGFNAARDAVDVFLGWWTGAGSDKTEPGWLTTIGEAGATLGDAWRDGTKLVQDTIDVFLGWWSGAGSDKTEPGWLTSAGEFAATLRDKWDALSTWFTGTFMPAFTGVLQGLGDRFSGLMPKVQEVADKIVPLLSAAWGAIEAGVKWVVGVITWVWDNWGQGILDTLRTIWDTVLGVLSGAFTAITGVFNFFKALFTGDWSGMWDAVKQIFSGIWESLGAILSGAWDILVRIVKAGAGWVWDQIVKMKDDVVGDFEELKNGASARISSLVDSVVGFFKGLPERIRSVLSGAGQVIWSTFAKPAIDAVNSVIEAFNALPGPDLPLLSTSSPFGGGGGDSQQSYNRNVPIGDTAGSMATGYGLANTLAAYRSMGAGLGISNIWVGGGGRGPGSGDHQAGRALDLVGSTGRMQGFITKARAAGDYATMHGTGVGRHVHYVPRPRLAAMAGVPSVPMVASGPMGDTATSMAGAGVYIAPGAIVVSGTSDPQAAASHALALLERKLANAAERR